jgi:hypothetical protein
MKAKFHDRNEQRDYLKVVELTRKLLADPAMAVPARDFVRNHMATDSHQAAYAAIWPDLLSRPVAEIARLLLEDTPEADLLRQTRPPCGDGFRSRDVARVIEAMDAEKRQY